MPSKETLLSLVIILIISCTPKEQFFELKNIDYSWHKDSVVKFNFTNKDTINNYNMFIHIRNTNDYKYDNLFLITSLKFPKGKVVVDTLEYKMAFANGKLMGEGFGSLKYNKLWYAENYKFTEKGTYTFAVRHAMRAYNNINALKNLEGIEEVGFSFIQKQ